jgi:anti-anti-sigma factor
MTDVAFSHLTARTDRGVLVLSITLPELHGDLATEALLSDLSRAIGDTPSPRVVLDCGKVQVLTSMGITALLRFRRMLGERTGRMVLCNVTPHVADVLGVTKLASPASSGAIPFPVVGDVESGVKALTPDK